MEIVIEGKAYLKAADAAQAAGVDVQTIYRWIKKNEIKGHKSGSKRWLVEKDSLYGHLSGRNVH